MQITREDLNACTVKLTVTCDADQVRQGFERAFRQLSKNIRLPGFRPGHAPRAMVEPLIPQGSLREAAAEAIIGTAFKQALAEQDLSPHGSPALDLTKLSQEESVCEFTLKVPLKPVVELGEYRGIPVQRPSPEITEEDIDRQIEVLRKGKASHEAVTDRGIELGDIAVVNVKAEGDRPDGRNFMATAGQTFEELDSALLGMKAEEIKSVELPFPDSFQEKDWAGKRMHCTLTVRSVSARKLPELDETFAQSFNLQNVEELRERVRQRIGEFQEGQIKEYMNEQILEEVLARSTVIVPDTMWEGVALQRLRDIEAEQKREGKSVEDYARENGMTVEQLVSAVQQEAATHVKRAVIVQEIAIKEDMKIGNQELNDELIYMAREHGMKPEELLAMLKKNDAVGELQHRAIFRKVTQFLNEHAVSQEVAMA